METLISVIVIFALLVSFHEFGHLLLAKRAGILCREFAIGFGPKLFSFKKGETVYTLRLLPIGGFVRMAGEDPEIVEIKAGHQVGLLFNKKSLVSNIIINKKDNYPDALPVTVEKADLEKELLIRAYEEEDGPLKDFPLDREAQYVMDGQAYQIAPLDRQFGSKSLLDRFLTIFAGPFMNFVLAFLAFFIYFSIAGVPSNAPELGKIVSGDPAASAGLKASDHVMQINNQPIHSWNDITSIVSKHPDQSMRFTVKRHGKIEQIKIKTGTRKGTNGQQEGFIGVYAPTEHGFLPAIKTGFTQIYFWVKQEIIGLKMLVTGAVGLDKLSGPVGIYNMTDKVVQHGLLLVLNWTAVLSINLGIINLLPLPALDGGRLLFLAIEGVRGKPVDPKRESFVHFIGFALLMLLMIVVTWNDIQKIFQ